MQYIILFGIVLVCMPFLLPFIIGIGVFYIVIKIISSLLSTNKSQSSNNNSFARNNEVFSSPKPSNIPINNNNPYFNPNNTITTKVAGVTFDNRQKHIKRLKQGERVKLIREVNNEYDKNAIAVYNSNNTQLGYIPKELAKNIHPLLDSGYIPRSSVKDVIGGNGLNYGLLIELNLFQPTKNKNISSNLNLVDEDSPRKRNIPLEKSNMIEVFDEVMESVILTAQKSNGFLQFVSQLEEAVLSFVLEYQYENTKSKNNFNSVHLGEYGCFGFSEMMLLYVYSRSKSDSTVANSCHEALIMAYKGTPLGVFSDMIDCVINEATNIPRKEWNDVYIYLRDNHGAMIRRFEFALDYTMTDHIRYREFINSL